MAETKQARLRQAMEELPIADLHPWTKTSNVKSLKREAKLLTAEEIKVVMTAETRAEAVTNSFLRLLKGRFRHPDAAFFH